jgi:hypothetical protein
MKEKVLQVIGWREWVSLPSLGIDKIKAKVDSGAKTSSIHAFNIKTYKRGNKQFVKFSLHPEQKNAENEIECRAEVLEFRKVKSSNGQSELRPVILTKIKVLEDTYEIEMTLTNRDEMGFRMLLGRESIRKRFLIDTGKSFNTSSEKKIKTKKGLSK